VDQVQGMGGGKVFGLCALRLVVELDRLELQSWNYNIKSKISDFKIVNAKRTTSRNLQSANLQSEI
jgi:hypothetical protein